MNKACVFALFVLCTIAGTLLHETGHYGAAVLLHCKPVLHYNSTSYLCGAGQSPVLKSLAGPFVNMFIGSVGFVALYKTHSGRKEKMILLLAAISFFWSRQVVVLGADLFIKPILHITSYLSDEQKASAALHLPLNTLPVATGITGLLICALTVYKLPGSKIRMTFIVYGASGALAGYVLWFKLLGPYLLP